MNPLPLNTATLSAHARRVAVPEYDRARLRPAVVHLGVGSFHRSHQAVYLDDLARTGDTDWGLVGVGLRNPEMEAALGAQDMLYTVLTRGADGDRARIVGSISNYLYARRDPEAVLASLTDERTRIVTLTITGHGYALPEPDEAEHGHDPRETTGLPSSALGYLVEALDRRRRAGLAPFTVLSCDNVPANGEVAHTAVTGFARRRDPRLAEWIAEQVAFPSSMVDRITPRTSDADRELLAREFGVRDNWPVVTEPFSQWVIEDDFCNGRPPLEQVGVQFVADVTPHALLKTRLLNAVHCVIGHLGYLAGHRHTHEVMGDPVFAGYVRQLIETEIAPLLRAPAGVDLDRYQEDVLERLANPKIGDSLARLCRNSSIKVPAHVIPTLQQARAVGTPSGLLTTAAAAWCLYLEGVDRSGAPIEIADPQAAKLRRLAQAGDGPAALLAERSLFGRLGEDERFVHALEHSMAALRDDPGRAVAEARPEPLRLAA